MTNLKVSTKTSFDVIPDTNIVFTKDNSKFLSPGFQKDWKALAEFAELKLLIPEMVRDERLFRVCTVASTALSKAKKELSLVENLAGIGTPSLQNENDVRNSVREAFDRFLAEFNAEVVPTPIEKIDWRDVIKASVWRVPPFIYEESSKTEKGFRDRMILETVIHYAETAENVVFLCGDGVLRTAVAERFGKSEKRLVFESLEGFSSYLKLLDERLTKQFVAMLLKKVEQVWLEKDPTKSIYQLLNIGDEVRRRFGIYLAMPSEKLIMFAPKDAKQVTVWTPSSEEKVFIGSTEFQKKTAKEVYAWKTTFEFVQLFKKAPPSALPLLDERIRISKFEASWSARVSEQAEFLSPSLTDIKMVDSDLFFTTQEILQQYGFEVASPSSQPNIDWSKIDYTKLGWLSNVDWSKIDLTKIIRNK